MIMVGRTLVLDYVGGVRPPGTSFVGRRDGYIQYLNILGISKPSTIYVFHRT